MNQIVTEKTVPTVLHQVRSEEVPSAEELRQLREVIWPRIQEGAGYYDTLDVLDIMPEIRKSQATAHGVGMFYRMRHPYPIGGDLDNILNCPSVRALRNRFRCTKDEVIKAGRNLHKLGLERKIIGAAAGSSLALLEGVAHLLFMHNIESTVRLIDIDPTALEDAERYAQKLGIGGCVRIQEGNVLPRTKNSMWSWPDLEDDYTIVEMVGLGDYLKEVSVGRLAKEFGHILQKNGVYISSNVVPHTLEPEGFIHHPDVFAWDDMYYREPTDFREMIAESFPGSVRVFTEKLRLHAITVAQKQ